MTSQDGTDTEGALTILRERIAMTRFPLELGDAPEARALRDRLAAQLDDYVLPRLARLDAPLIAVVGGSTGAGKSTLVNTIVGEPVTRTGVLRPTTRSPVLAHHPADENWFAGDRILPRLVRVTGDDPVGVKSLRLVSTAAVPQGLAVLDTPDIDSVVARNRDLATQLLKAADLWIFVTTAARYADAVPWDFLREAVRRHAAVAVVLDRVSAEAVPEVRQHLAAMLDDRGLGDAPVFVVEESALDESGMVPPDQISPLKTWLVSLAADPDVRSDLAVRTLTGAITDILKQAPTVADAAETQATMAEQLRSAAVMAYDEAQAGIRKATQDGSLLRGQVLARWQDLVGTGDLFRSLEQKVSQIRDRVAALFTSRPEPLAEVEAAIEHGLRALVVDHANVAAEQVDGLWRADPAGRALLGKNDLSRSSPEFADRASGLVREWQESVSGLVRDEARDKRFIAQVTSDGGRGLGVALMVVAVASPAGSTAAEATTAGGAAVVGHQLLEAVFGDHAVQRLADSVRKDLHTRVEVLLNDEAERFTERIEVLAVDSAASAALREATENVERVPGREGL